MSHPCVWGIRRNLVLMWVLSCVVGWLVRWAALEIPGVAAHLNVFDRAVDPFKWYSSVEAVSRAMQGTTFFLLVSLKALGEAFSDFKHENRE